ncbi:hypothetical protein [Streptomyces venezuelae]|uniref:hypothetical protein n=1 Tax=Streptomyces venezuelae TaxID=54571 RepID=UPI00342D9CEE
MRLLVLVLDLSGAASRFLSALGFLWRALLAGLVLAFVSYPATAVLRAVSDTAAAVGTLPLAITCFLLAGVLVTIAAALRSQR